MSVKKKSVVLVPYDFGPKSQSALEEAKKVTKYLNGEIYLLTVVRRPDFLTQLFRSEKEHRKNIRAVQNKLKEVVEKTRETTNIKIHYIVEEGSPIEVIIEQAELLSAQYIVMGKMDKTVSEFHFVGPLTTSVVASAPCPVMTVGTNQIKEEGFSNIVLPIDLTKSTLEKVVKAVSWAKYYKSTIHLVGVLKKGANIATSRLVMKMEKAKWIVEQEGVDVTAQTYIDSDEPIDEIIIRHVEQVNGDLLMIMTHQELGVNDTYIGAVAQNLLKKSDVPTVSFTTKAISHNDYFVSNFLPFELLSVKESKILRK